jgi:hypothetical protein
MIEQEFILLIMNCKKYIKKADYQKQTWLKTLPSYIKYYHVIGDNNLDSEYKFDEEKQFLYVKTDDDYISLPKKVITSYKAINETFIFKYIFKTDDDQILIKPPFFDMLVKMIKECNPKTHYGGFSVNIERPTVSNYYKIHPELPTNLVLQVTKYCSGRFYYLSKDSITYLLTKINNIKNEFFEDYAIGVHLHPHYKTSLLHILTNKFFIDNQKPL